MTEENSFGFSYYQIIGLILSNIYPIEICIIIAKYLKLADFEFSRQNYLKDYLTYKELKPYSFKKNKNIDDEYSFYFKNPNHGLRIRLKNKLFPNPNTKLIPSFNLRPYLNDSGFGQKYDLVVQNLKQYIKDYKFINSLEIRPFMEFSAYVLKRTRTPHYHQQPMNMGMWFIFHESRRILPKKKENTKTIILNTIKVNEYVSKKMIKDSKKNKKNSTQIYEKTKTKFSNQQTRYVNFNHTNYKKNFR